MYLKYVTFFFFFFHVQIHNLQFQSCRALGEICPNLLSNSDLVKPNIWNSDFRFRTFFSPHHEVPPPNGSGGAFEAPRADTDCDGLDRSMPAAAAPGLTVGRCY